MKWLADEEIKFMKETGWTPTVTQANEWNRTIFFKLFGKGDVAEGEDAADWFLSKASDYALKEYSVNLSELYNKCTEEHDDISLEYEATYLFYLFFSKDELEELTDEKATDFLQDFQYYFGYRKWSAGNLRYVQEAIEAHNGTRLFYLTPDGEVWNAPLDEIENDQYFKEKEFI